MLHLTAILASRVHQRLLKKIDIVMHNRQTKLKIAISDDSPFIADSIRHILNSDLANMDVNVYPSQNQALLDKLQSEPVDLLITDFNLTFDNSLGGIKKIQAICRKAAGAKVIILTSQQTYNAMRKLLLSSNTDLIKYVYSQNML